ncbi:MAG: hypothetical protein EB071_12840 [Gammaproteobacteria bacterium]|nr:hypothetical protein [Gammaproteobacteria bacterium]
MLFFKGAVTRAGNQLIDPVTNKSVLVLGGCNGFEATFILITAILVYPSCMKDWQVKLAAQLATHLLPYLHPFADYDIQVEGKAINFLMLIPPHAPDPGSVRGKSYPLLQLSGIPLYMALMLATPNVMKHLKAFVIGIMIVALSGFMGVVIEGSRHLLGGLVMLNVDLKKLAGLPSYALFFAKYLELLSMLVLPLLLPVAVWVCQRRDFVLNMIASKPS